MANPDKDKAGPFVQSPYRPGEAAAPTDHARPSTLDGELKYGVGADLRQHLVCVVI
jgi:hypothetical protein